MPSCDDDMSRHDVVMIGAGPAGEPAAELGRGLAYSVALRAMRLPSRAQRI
jgi:pyruvate/2-oxoglutarate dehydrogenase complex dihydrolipoamide dehydrogenase (E3) component